MSIDELEKMVKSLNINFNDDVKSKLIIYKDFLKEYNSHTNLTAITNDEDIYLKHFYDSITIVKATDLNKVNTLIDVGTGAGFPGMIIKIFFPNIKVTLLDANNKKVKFLQELKDKLDLDVEIINARIEDYAKTNLNKFDVVTSRAVASLRILSELSIPLVKEDGYFIPLKGSIDKELSEAEGTITAMDSKLEKIINFNLYHEEGVRNILLIKKLKATNIKMLRRYDKILKYPLVKNA